MQSLGSVTNGAVVNTRLLAGSFAKLSAAQIANIASTTGLDAATLSATLKAAGFNQEERNQIAMLWQDIVAKKANTAATGTMTAAEEGATGATWSLTAAMDGLGKVMKAHPVLSFLAVAAVVVPLVAKAFDALTTSAEEQAEALAKTQQRYEDVTSELESLEDELEAVRAKMSEIEKFNPEWKTDEEHQKLTLLNDELEREIRLLEREQELAAKDNEEQAVKNATSKQELYPLKAGWETFAGADTGAQMLNDVDYLNRIIELVNENRQLYAEFQQAQLDNPDAAGFIEKTKIQPLQQQYDWLIQAGTEAARNNQNLAASISGVTAEGRELKPQLEASVEDWLDLADGVDLTTRNLQAAQVAMRSFSDIAAAVEQPVEAISEAEQDMANYGYLSADAIKALEDAGLEEYLVEVAGGYQLADGALQDYLESQKSFYTKELDSAITAFQKLMDQQYDLADSYDGTTESMLRQVKAAKAVAFSNLIEAESAYIKKRQESDGEFFWLPDARRDFSGSQAYQEIYNEVQRIDTLYNNILAAQGNVDMFDRWTDTSERDKNNANKDKTDPNKSEFEELYDKWKHDLDLEKITLKEFNDWLDGNDGYKKYFADRTKYADEWRKYEKEVFDNSMQLHEQEATNLDHTIEMLKLQGKSEQDILDAYRKKQTLLENARDLVYDFLKAQGLSEKQIASNSTLQELEKSIFDNRSEATDFYRERVDAHVADFEHEIDMLERVEGKENELIAKYREEQAYLVSVREEYRKTLVAAGKTADEIAKDDWFQELTEQIHDVNDAIDDVFQDVFDRISGDLNELLDLTKELIQHEKEEQIEALEDQKDAFSDLIDAKKEMLRLTREEQEYNDKVAKSTKDIAKLQSRIDALALDDSRQAALERGKLEEELAELQKELADTQNDHYISKTEEALDKEEEEYHDLMDAKIKDIENFLDDNEAMTNAALARLDTANDTLFKQLESYAKHYTDTTGAELQSMWDTAMKAAQKYGSFTSSMQMFTESDVQTEAQSIVAKMRRNGDMWASNPDPVSRQKYSDANLDLGEQLQDLLGVKVERIDGTWYIGEGSSRKKLYDVFSYHTGGVVGDTASVSPKADELFALLQRDEVVMSRNMVNNTFDFLVGLPKVMASAFHAPLSLASQAMNGLKEYVIHISAPLTMDGVLPKDEILSTIQQYPRKIAEVVASQIQKL